MSSYLYISDEPLSTNGKVIALGSNRYLSAVNLQGEGVTTVGQWANDGTKIFCDEALYEEHFREFANDADGSATDQLDFHHWAGHKQRHLQEPEEEVPVVGMKEYPPGNQPFAVTMRRRYVEDGGWPGWYWDFIVEFADPNRDPGVRTVGIYDSNWNYLYTVGGLVYTDTGEVDENDDPIMKWMGQCPAGYQTVEKEDIYYGLLYASLIEGKMVLPAAEDEQTKMFWDHNVSGASVSNVLDLDHDGLPDTVVVTNNAGVPIVTGDIDSVNVDTGGDGVAEIVIPKKGKG